MSAPQTGPAEWAVVRDGQVVGFLRDNSTFVEGKKHRSVQHSYRVWGRWSPERKRAAGIYPISRASKKDTRFYMASPPAYEVKDDVVVEHVSFEPRPVEVARGVVRARVNAARSKVLYQPVPITVGDRKVSVSMVDLPSLSAMAASFGPRGRVPSDFAWRDANNVAHPLSARDLTDLAGALATWVDAVHRASWSKKADVDAMADVHALAAYDAEAGWPDPGALQL